MADFWAAVATLGGVLVLDVKTWPGNTRLAKAVAAGGLTNYVKGAPPAAS